MHYFVALVASCVLVAAAPLLVRFSPVDPTATLWLRMVLATGVLIAITPARLANAEPLRRRDYLLLVAAGLLSVGDMAANHWAAVETTVANAVLLMNLSPVFVTLLAIVFLRERPSMGQLTGYGVTIGGAALMTGASFEGWRLGLGEGLALLSAFLYAAYFLVVKDLRRRMSATQIMLWTSGIAAALLAPVAIGSSDPLLPSAAPGWLPIVAMALGVQIGGHGLMAYAMHGLPASYASATALARPVLAAAAAWLLFEEAMGPWQMAGAVLVLGGLAVAARRSLDSQPTLADRAAAPVLAARTLPGARGCR
ncbi:DMT family transporter [Microvirga sp. GCM10011540]|uniref:DMT family transporter n=1 Tax=Microvirga sp. GCM10011540 TaxID=3317338 RepID=UPI003606FF1E